MSSCIFYQNTSISQKKSSLIQSQYYLAIKVKLSLCLVTTPYRRIRGMEIKIYAFLTSILERDEYSGSRPGWGISPRYSLDRMPSESLSLSVWMLWWKENYLLWRESNPDCPDHSQSLSSLRYLISKQYKREFWVIQEVLVQWLWCHDSVTGVSLVRIGHTTYMWSSKYIFQAENGYLQWPNSVKDMMITNI
jgi:hypothetical protein